jgi:hypothetical protein
MRTRYVQIDGQLVEVGKDFVQVREAGVAHNIIPDIQPYQSMATGEMIGGRRQHREHLRQHGLVEVGNEHDKLKPFKVKPSVNWNEAIREQMGRRGLL